MKALKHKETGEWLSRIMYNGELTNGIMPKILYDTAKNAQQVQDEWNQLNHKQIDLSMYELIEIEIIEKVK